MKTNHEIIGAEFHSGFTIKIGKETIRCYKCEHHDDTRRCIVQDGKKFFLVKQASRDEGFQEISRREIPGTALVTHGYHDDEHGEWQTVADKAAQS